MEQLLDQESLHFVLEDGAFDVEAIAAQCAALGHGFRDETDPRKFVICLDDATRDRYAEYRKENPEGGFPIVLLIVAMPEEVIVSLMAGPRYWEKATAFIEWFSPAYPKATVTNQNGVDLTGHLPR